MAKILRLNEVSNFCINQSNFKKEANHGKGGVETTLWVDLRIGSCS